MTPQRLEDIPRCHLGRFPTPLHAVDGYDDLWIKRDDLSGFGWAGNKARPLEFLLAEARQQDAPCVISGGAPTSNFIAALAAAACHEGMHCHLLVPAPVQSTTTVRLARLVGAEVEEVDAPRDRLDELVARRAQELRELGHAAYPIPRGGATPTGALGFASGVSELAQQRADADGPGARPATVVLPVGSGASIAGILAGIALHGLPFRVVGVSVSRPPGEIESAMRSMAGAVLGRVGADPARMDSVDVVLVDRRHAPEASVAQAAARDLACRGLIVDGHYGLPSWLVAEELAGPDRPVIFWHTGGTAGVPHLLAEIQGESHG